MVKEAEQYQARGFQRREAVDVKNSAENLLFNTRKSLNDYKEKLSEQEISDLEEAMKHFEEVIQSDDTEKIKSETGDFYAESTEAQEAIYKRSAGTRSSGGGSSGSSGAAAGEASTEEADENVVDAEFEKVEDEKQIYFWGGEFSSP